MRILLITYYFLSLIIWGIVPIRQKDGRYFLFFLILIVGDLVTIGIRLLDQSSNFFLTANFIYVISAMLRLIVVQEKKIHISTAIFIIFISLASIIFEINGLSYKNEVALLSIFHFLFLFKFLQNFIITLTEKKIINIFLVCLIFYEITAATKYFGLITGFVNANSYYLITTIFEILIGIFFCIFREDNPRILIPLEKIGINA